MPEVHHLGGLVAIAHRAGYERLDTVKQAKLRIVLTAEPLEFWARKNIGDEAVEYLKKNIHPLDLAFRLAEDHGIVLLNGGGFEAP